MAQYQVSRIDDKTWRIDEAGVRFFLLEGTKRALLIDSGMQVHNALEIAQGLTGLPVSLLNTHADPDHTGSNHEFASFCMHPAEATNYYKRHRGTGGIVPVWDGDILDLGERTLEIIALPGHTPGSVAVLDKERRRLFSGDTVQDADIFMFGEHREMHAYILSLERLLGMKGRFDEIWPSHGTCPLGNDFIAPLLDGARSVLAGKIKGSPIEVFGRACLRCGIGVAAFLTDGEEQEDNHADTLV